MRWQSAQAECVTENLWARHTNGGGGRYCPSVERVKLGFLFSEMHHEVWAERNTEIQN